jgi:glycosyltransferase involved in cell wall biosynthesis/peptidoglycan/xylan/chitin deacetylase (PgdA/CDA1 family)
MKLLIITNLFPNKKEPTRGIFNKQQFFELAKLCELKVIAPVPWHKAQGIPGREAIDGIDVYHPRYFMIPKIGRSLYGIFFFLGLIGTVRRIKQVFCFDSILATWAYPDGFAASLLARLLKKPLVIKVHGSDINISTRYFIRRKMIVWALNSSEKVIAVSAALKEEMVKIGVPSEKIVIVPNGVDAELFKPMDQAECRKKLELPLDKKIVLFVGNLVRVKGVEALVSAFADLRVSALLVLVGDGPLEGILRAKVKELNIKNRVIFAGRITHDAIRNYMNACDIFCLASLNEGCPNVALEAMACGKPVVATKVGGLPEIVTDETGLLVEPQNVSALADELSAALERAWSVDAIRKEALRFDWKRSAEMLGEVLMSIDHRPQTGDRRPKIKDMIKEFISAITPKSAVIWRGDRNKKLVALTFDDGPNSVFTPRILNILKDRSVKATFFLVGRDVERNKSLAKQIADEGHSVGMHSYSHNRFGESGIDARKAEIAKSRKALCDEIGATVNLFRPPQGSLSLTQLLYCKKNNITTVMWSLDSDDFRVKDAHLLVDRASGGRIKNGEIILFHDDNESTVSALPQIIRNLSDKGFEFATVEEMLK